MFDQGKVFAEKLTLPAGAVWYRNSLYVASPPDLLRFEDTNGDGVADVREVVVTGWNMSANAASLHGPIFGPTAGSTSPTAATASTSTRKTAGTTRVSDRASGACAPTAQASNG